MGTKCRALPYGLGENKNWNIGGNAINGDLGKWVHIMWQPSMLPVNAYVMVYWQGILILLFLERVVKGARFDNLTTIITNIVNIYGGFDNTTWEHFLIF